MEGLAVAVNMATKCASAVEDGGPRDGCEHLATKCVDGSRWKF